VKTRQGFVSNSSSSSFIVGVAKIKKSETAQFKKWLFDLNKERGCQDYDRETQVLSTTDVLRAKDHSYFIECDGESVIVDAEVNTEPTVSIKLDASKDDEYFVVHIGNDEGDGNFWNEYSGNYDYDKVDEDYFTGYQKEILNVLMGSGFFSNVDYKIGAARNG